MKHFPAVASILGVAAIVAATAGLAGRWWAVLVAGVLLLSWSVLATADSRGR